MEKSHFARNWKNCLTAVLCFASTASKESTAMLCKICKLGVLMLAFQSRYFPRWDPWETVRFLQHALIFFSPAFRNGYASSRNDNHIQEQISTECYSQYSYFWLTKTAKPPLFSMALHCLWRSQKSRHLSGDQGLLTWVLLEIQG